MSKTTDFIIDEMYKKKAIIVDIDGTLAKICNREIFDYPQAINDEVHYHIADLIDRYRHDHLIILLSGRDEECRDVTVNWLKKNRIGYHLLLMRKRGDKRDDTIVKKELYKRHIQGRYDVTFVLDDRARVVDMWREIGLVCLQVAADYC